jgi:hypothetical protein
MNPQQQRIGIMVLAGIFGVMVLIGLGIALFQSQKGKVITTITPNDAIVKLDGREVKGDDTHFVDPGKHQFVITRQAFIEKKVDFEIKAGETQTMELFIVPDETAGLEWVKQNPEQAMQLDGFMSNEYNANADRVYKGNQILSALPIIDGTFRIDQGFSKTGRDFALYIQANDQEARTAAIETLKYLGYDPSAFEIIYTTPGQ